MKVVLRLVLLITIMVGLVLGYYWLMQRFAASSDNLVGQEQIEQWRQTTVQGEPIIVVGALTQENSLYYLKLGEVGKTQVGSNSLSLSSYVGMRVEVVAEFRDGRLQVQKIQELD